MGRLNGEARWKSVMAEEESPLQKRQSTEMKNGGKECVDQVVSITEGKNIIWIASNSDLSVLEQCSIFDYFPKPAN